MDSTRTQWAPPPVRCVLQELLRLSPGSRIFRDAHRAQSDHEALPDRENAVIHHKILKLVMQLVMVRRDPSPGKITMLQLSSFCASSLTDISLRIWSLGNSPTGFYLVSRFLNRVIVGVSCVEICPSGHYPITPLSPPTIPFCRLAAPGFYANGVTNIICAVGTYSDTVGATACTNCTAGTHSSETGSASCAACSGLTDAGVVGCDSISGGPVW